MYPSTPEKIFKGLALRQREDAGRPKIGIVLSGGGARGLAQIGVLKVLEQHHIAVDAVVGNSLGSVIGGMYAAGYTTSQIESVALHTDWSELLSFSEETKRTDLFVGQKDAQEEGYLVIRFDGLQPIIPSSISGGQRISNFFSTLALQALYHPGPSFDNLKIPYRAVATDLLSGRRVILDHGSLAEAMRASVTVPLLYSPLVKDSMSLVDGGLTSNIPVDLAKSLGCDIIIAVNSTSPMRNASQLSAPWEIADQIMTIMMQDANRRQLEGADIVVTPEVGHRLVSDFSDIPEIIDSGRAAAEQQVQALQLLIDKFIRDGGGIDTLRVVGPKITFTGDSIDVMIRDEILTAHRTHTTTSRLVTKNLDRLLAAGMQPRAEISSSPASTEIIYHATRIPLISSFAVLGDAKDLISADLLSESFGTLKGTLFNPDTLQRSLENLLSSFRQRGYSLARIESVQFDPAAGRISLIVHQGRIGQIMYEGNERTKDYIIRRELPLSEGEVFNADKAYQGIVNVKSTGLFDYVLLEVRYRDDEPILIIKVKEKSSELLRLGLHADNEHALVTTIDIHDANFRGAWEDVGLLGRYGYRDRMVRLNYTINRIFHSYLTLNTKLYFKSRDVITYEDDPTLGPEQWDRIEEGRYRENKYGWSLAFGSHFERFGDITAELRIENQKIAAISGGGYTPERYQFVGLKFQSIVDTKDKFWFPTAGMRFHLSYESAMQNLGSEVGYGKIAATYESYFTIAPRHTIHPRLEVGYADATLPTAEQFTLGGFQSFYGLNEDDSRGRQLFVANLEYRFWFPFKIIFETYIKARYDLGTISGEPQELTLGNFLHGVGAEIDLDTPIGPAAFGLGKAYYFRKDLPDSPVSVGPLLFYFSIGSSL